MPVATSSRRKVARRQASSDIEEDQATQAKGLDNVDEDEDEEEQPRRRAKSSKQTANKRRAEPARGNVDDEDEDDDRIDVANFHDQPLGKGDLPKLKGLSSDWQHMEKKIEQSWAVVGDVASAMAESAEGDEGEKGLAELDIIMKDLITISAEMKSHGEAVDDIYQKVGQGENIDDAVDRYKAGVEVRVKEYAKKTTRQKYAKNAQYILFREGIYEVQHRDRAMPPITDFIPKEDGDDSDDDDDLEMGGVTQTYTCPITLTPLEDPLTSEVCGHSFSAEAIRATFRGSLGSKKCPASGCNKSFTLSQCKPNKDLAKRVKAYQRRTRRAEENSDTEEIIE